MLTIIYVYNCTFWHKNDYDRNNVSYKSNRSIKLHKNVAIKINVTALICSNFNSYLTVMSSIYLPHLQLIIYKSYANHVS